MDRPGAGDRKRASKQASGPVAMCMGFLLVIEFFGIFIVVALTISGQAQQLNTERPGQYDQRRRQGWEEF
jgi:hypothetical protein